MSSFMTAEKCVIARAFDGVSPGLNLAKGCVICVDSSKHAMV